MKKLILTSLISVAALSACSVQKNTGAPITDSELMDRAQRDALKYFWDFAEPHSLMGRERYHEDGIYPEKDENIVTTGGSGFGLATILVGIERGFVPRQEAVKRLDHIADFLAKADRFKGAWPHWINGETGKVKPFGKKDNGGDLVETAFLAESMIIIREYLKNGTHEEQKVAKKYDELWRGIQWNWYTKGGEKVLYWHWSPDYQWEMNFPLQGYNECLATYVMAAASPTYPIDKETFTKGWSRSGKIISNNTKYGMPLLVKHNYSEEYGGPLFWAHYSYIGLDPRGLSDDFVENYFDLNKNQVMIDYNYCVENPKKWNGYGENYWGLTAGYTRNSDGSAGYTAHQPTNDTGVINLTAALSSMPYSPKESMQVLRFIYTQKTEFIGTAGPYDATSIHYNWTVPHYLAIDQGTISPMIENYRTGFLWKLFMNAPEIKAGLRKLGFKSSQYGIK